MVKWLYRRHMCPPHTLMTLTQTNGLLHPIIHQTLYMIMVQASTTQELRLIADKQTEH